MAGRSVWQAFRDNPEWRRIYFARSASLLGTWLNTLAIVHLLGEGEVYAALPIAGVFVLKQIPVSLLGPAAGVVADRYDRRTIMILCDVLTAAVVALFLLTEQGGSVVYIYALTLLQVCVTAFFDPAYRAVIPDLVRDDDLITANAISAATWSLMFATGAAVGGVVLYAFGWRVAIALDVASYLISALLIATVKDERTKPPPHPEDRALSGLADVRAGLAYLKEHPKVRHILLTKSVWGMMGAHTLFLTMLGASPGFRLRESADLGISFLWFCRAIGTGLGPLVARRFANGDAWRLRASIVVGFCFSLGFYFSLVFVDTPWMAGMCALFAHMGGATVWVMSTVLLQQMVPSGFRGRTFATELGSVMLISSCSYLAYALVMDYGGLSPGVTVAIAASIAAGPALIWSVISLRAER